MGDNEIQAPEYLDRKLNASWKSGMFRPAWIFPSSTFGDWRCCKEYTLQFIPNFHELLSKFLLPDPSDPPVLYQVAGHKGLLCIDVRFVPKMLIVCRVCNPFQKDVVYTLPALNKLGQTVTCVISLMHVRMDDRGEYKVLVAGSYISADSGERFLCTEEYDSTQNVWVCAETRDIPGSLKELQNGAYYKDYNEEFLFCISSLDIMQGINQGVLRYDFKKQHWSTCQLPLEVTTDGSNTVSNTVHPVHVEECGGNIFLFSEQKHGEHVYFFIHKLNVDGAEDVKWEEITRKQRTAIGQPAGKFLVYPDTTQVPSREDIEQCGGCVFAFSLQKSGNELCIYELTFDGSGGGMWGPREIKRLETAPKQRRAPKWTDIEKHAHLLLRLEVASAGGAEKPDHWSFHISQVLWEWGGFDRRPKSCQDQMDSLIKAYNKIVDAQKSKNDGLVNIVGMNQECFDLIKKLLEVEEKKGTSAAKAMAPKRASKRSKRGVEETMDPFMQPSSSNAALELSDAPSKGTLPSTSTILSVGLDTAASGRTSTKSIEHNMVSDFQRVVNFFQGSGRELTDDQELELITKTKKLNFLRAENKMVNIVSEFDETILYLETRDSKPTCKRLTGLSCFELLKTSLDTDILRLENRSQQPSSL